MIPACVKQILLVRNKKKGAIISYYHAFISGGLIHDLNRSAFVHFFCDEIQGFENNIQGCGPWCSASVLYRYEPTCACGPITCLNVLKYSWEWDNSSKHHTTSHLSAFLGGSTSSCSTFKTLTDFNLYLINWWITLKYEIHNNNKAMTFNQIIHLSVIIPHDFIQTRLQKWEKEHPCAFNTLIQD